MDGSPGQQLLSATVADGVLSMAECGCQDIIYDMLDHGPLLITYLESGALPVPWVCYFLKTDTRVSKTYLASCCGRIILSLVHPFIF
jgi:hypothetical protein